LSTSPNAEDKIIKALPGGTERYNSISTWEKLRLLAEDRPTLSKRENCFLDKVRVFVDEGDCASHTRVSNELLDWDPKFFSDQKAVDEVEKELLKKDIIRIVKGPFSEIDPDYSLMYNEEFVKGIKAGIPKSATSIEFVDGIPNINIILEMQERLIYLIEQEYPNCSRQEILILENIVFCMVSEKCFAIYVDDLIFHTARLGKHIINSWEEAEATINLLIDKKIIQSVYAGDEWLDNDNKITRSMPTIHLMLESRFASKAISLLNFTFAEEKEKKLSTLKRRVGQYRVEP
jgi:hypothetical protein